MKPQTLKKGVTTSARLLAEIRHLHPELSFCGEPKNAILKVPDGLVNYVLSLLKNDRVRPPQVSMAQWRELLHILKSHWIIPLLYWQAGRLPDEFRPPASILDQMRDAFQWSRVRCLQMEKQLREIAAAFKAEGIRVLVLKGPAYGRTVYPDPALRPGSDLDLLVLPDQMRLSEAILEDLGYRCDAKLFDASEKLYKDEKFVHLKNPRDYLTIELHWRLHSFLGIRQDAGPEELFFRAKTVTGPSLVFEALGPVDALIHTAINNAFGHYDGMRLIWVHDVATLSSSLTVPDQWELLQERCVAWRARLAVELSLTMAREWLGLLLPSGFQDFSTWPRPTEIEAEAWEKIVHRHRDLSTLLKLRLPPCSGPIEKARLLFRLFFPPLDKVRKDFPTGKGFLVPLSYARRWRHWVEKLRS